MNATSVASDPVNLSEVHCSCLFSRKNLVSKLKLASTGSLVCWNLIGSSKVIGFLGVHSSGKEYSMSCWYLKTEHKHMCKESFVAKIFNTVFSRKGRGILQIDVKSKWALIKHYDKDQLNNIGDQRCIQDSSSGCGQYFFDHALQNLVNAGKRSSWNIL